MKTIFIHSQNGQPKRVDLELSVKVSELLKNHIASDDSKEFDVYLLDGDRPLAKGNTLESQGVSDKSSLVISSCKKVQVLVVYNGVQFVESYPPAANFRSVFNRAINHFGISGSEKDEFELYLSQDANSKVNLSYPVGAYVSGVDCRVQVYLLKPSSFQGYDH